MCAKSSTPMSASHTKAWLACKQNLESISHMVYMGGREMRLVKAETIRVTNFLRKKGSNWSKADIAKLERFSQTLESRIDRYMTASSWQVVMLVTCVEAYLQDLLSAAARVGPELMSESQQLAPYADVITATSLDELANDLRARWARGWLSDGGPTRWISRLEKMGVRGFPSDLAPRLELIWGIRHVIVHAAGIATKDFVKRHPEVNTAVGNRLRVNSRSFKAFLAPVGSFIELTDTYFLTRFPSLVDPGTPKASK